MPTYAPLPSSPSSLDLPRSPSASSERRHKRLPARTYHLLRRARRCLARGCRPRYLSGLFAVALAWQLLCNASYAPATAPAFAIPPHETVFIAANILSGPLITGPWGQSLVQLVEAIGRDRVFVSIYGGPTEALRGLGEMLGEGVQKSLVSEETQPLDLGAMPRTTLPGGERRVKRIAWLAAVRNKVLEPLYWHAVQGRVRGGFRGELEILRYVRDPGQPEPFWDSSECCLIHADILSLPSPPRGETGSGARDEWDTGIYLNPYVRTSYSARTHAHRALAQRFERLLSPVQRVLNICARMPRGNYRRGETAGEVVDDQLWISVHANQTEREAVAAAEPALDGSSLGPGLDAGGRGDGAARRGRVGERATRGTPLSREAWSTEGYYVPFRRTATRGGYCGVRQLLVMKEGPLEAGEGNWDNLLDQVPPVDV
ncbi:hypothetical protein BUE80_DR013735 [Diplocarpon rosae]|nr:hypothetical protein BUE80_DR013735 [Diplocarpon rosae]